MSGIFENKPELTRAIAACKNDDDAARDYIGGLTSQERERLMEQVDDAVAKTVAALRPIADALSDWSACIVESWHAMAAEILGETAVGGDE